MKKTPAQHFRYETYSFIFLLVGITGLLFYMSWNFLTPIIFAGIVAGTFYPLLNYIINKTKWSRTTASLLVCLLIIVLLFIPTIYIVVRISQEILAVYSSLKEVLTGENLNAIFFGEHYFAQLAMKIFTFLNMEYSMKTIEDLILGSAKSVSFFLFNRVNTMIGNVFSFIFQFLLMLLGIYAIFLEGPNIHKFLLRLSPIRDEDEELIIKQFNRMNYVTLVFNGIGGLIQGVLAGIGFWIVGIQSILLWTTLMIFLAFIPLLGISLVYIPATIYLLLTGQIWHGVFLFIYCSTISIVTENWFKPAFMGKQVEINSFLVFFSIIGGMSVFGMAGIFYGPLVVSLFLTVAKIYNQKYERLLQKEG
ncbi:MAG: AI-2E family transporter [Leptospira sp.]|nr:AI-2E family transporter [Leptospira sp.]